MGRLESTEWPKNRPSPAADSASACERLLLLVLLFAAPRWGWTLHKVREQARAIAVLEAMGCDVSRGEPESPTVLEWLRGLLGESEPGNAWIVSRHHLQTINHGELSLVEAGQWTGDEPQLTDDGLAFIRSMTDLTKLGIARTSITDAGLVNLRGLTKLDCLTLGGTPRG